MAESTGRNAKANCIQEVEAGDELQDLLEQIGRDCVIGCWEQDDCNVQDVLIVKEIEDGNEMISYMDAQGNDLGDIGANVTVGACNVRLVTGYIEECEAFDDIELPINQDMTFSDNVGPVNTIATDANTAQLLVETLEQAQEREEAEIASGVPVTNYFITTEGGNVYEFPPSAFTGQNGTLLEFDQSAVVSWPGPETDTVDNITYSVLDDCECRQIEMVQHLRDDGTACLIRIIDTFGSDITSGEKPEVDFPLPFGTRGPFPGQCPDDTQVIDVEELCCNEDLANNEPDVAAQRLAWLDAADTSLMTPDGGAIGTAVDGDEIVQVDDKLASGTNFVVPAAVGPGDLPPATGPTLNTNGVNDLPVLEFDAADRDRLRLDTNNPPGGSFTLFYLFSAQVSGDNNQAILSVGPNNSDGDAYHTNDGAWQFSRDGANQTFIFRIAGNQGDNDPTDVTAAISNPTDSTWANSVTWEQTIAPLNEAYNGQLHLITASFNNATDTLQIYFDGELRYEGIVDPASAGFANLASDYFRVFGNRAGDAYSTGRIAEMFFADSAMTEEDTATVNAYLICKWGIDPSLAAGGAGDLTLAPAGTYDTPTPFRRITNNDGSIEYLNSNNGLRYPVPPVPGLSICDAGANDTEMICLCDDNGAFLRHISYGTDGNIVRDTELDGLTEYATVGAVVKCTDAGTAPCTENVYGDGFVGVAPESPPANSMSATLTVLNGAVLVTTPTGAFVAPAGSSFSWAEGNSEISDVDQITFAGVDATSSFVIHGETCN